MRGKIILLTGVAIGYVLGAKAGRERYNQIARVADKVWTDPRVQGQVDKVETYVKEKAPVVGKFVANKTKVAAKAVQEKAAEVKDKATDTEKSADASI